MVSQFRAGGLPARSLDEKIPLKYGIAGQETTGPGGFANALRTVPVALDICRGIEELCPEAWLINFTNPSGIVTEAVTRHSKVKCVGLCNVPVNMEREIVRALGMDASRVRCRFAGLNHLSFVVRLFVDGKDILASGEGARLVEGSVVRNIRGSEIPSEFIETLGCIPSPYLKYYYLEKEMFREELRDYEATGRTRADEVMEAEALLFEKYRDESLDEKPPELALRGGALYSEAAVALMRSLWNDAGDVQAVNVPNRGCIPDVPDDAVVEASCAIRRGGPEPLPCGPLPETVAGLVRHVKSYERLTIEAALEGSARKAVAALANHPLVRDVTVAKPLVEDILRANADHLKSFYTGRV